MNILLSIFALLMFADFTTTRLVIYRGGREVIPYLAWLMGKIGVIPALLIAKAIPIGAVLYLYKYGFNGTELTTEAMAWICAGYTVIIENNYRALKRQEHKQ